MIPFIIGDYVMSEKVCGNCKYFSFNKVSVSTFDERHYCNLAIKEGLFDDKICKRLPNESCENWG